MLMLIITAALASDPLPDHMDDHFAAAADTMWDVSVGEVVRARTEVGRLDHEPPHFIDAALVAHAKQVRAAVEDVQEARTVRQTADAVAHLGATCAACHRAAGRGAESAPRYARDNSDSSERQRHIWTLSWMWYGLVSPDRGAWKGGARLAVLPSNHYRRSGVARFARRYEAAAREALAARTDDQRASAFGKMLATCSRCHDATAVERSP